MRRSLWWALVATVPMSLLALWKPKPPAVVQAITPRLHEHSQALQSLAAVDPGARASSAPLPETLTAIEIAPAQRDIFAPTWVKPRIERASTVTPIPPAPTQSIAPVPQAPPVNLRYLGSMITPEGKRLLYMARGDVTLSIAQGDQIDNGFVVQAITADAVTLVYPPLGTEVIVPITPVALP